MTGCRISLIYSPNEYGPRDCLDFLSWDGLPCPNLSTGGYNYHGVREWIPADSLEAMTNVLVTLTESFAE